MNQVPLHIWDFLLPKPNVKPQGAIRGIRGCTEEAWRLENNHFRMCVLPKGHEGLHLDFSDYYDFPPRPEQRTV